MFFLFISSFPIPFLTHLFICFPSFPLIFRIFSDFQQYYGIPHFYGIPPSTWLIHISPIHTLQTLSHLHPLLSQTTSASARPCHMHQYVENRIFIHPVLISLPFPILFSGLYSSNHSNHYPLTPHLHDHCEHHAIPSSCSPEIANHQFTMQKTNPFIMLGKRLTDCVYPMIPSVN